jgi:LacI family transcriptional regulator
MYCVNKFGLGSALCESALNIAPVMTGIVKTMQKMTLEDIAQIAGVSRSTVSRVINDHPNVSDRVRQRVWEVVNRTGYQPNQAARSLASQRSNIIGLVVPRSVSIFFTDPYLPHLTQGIAQACNQYDYTLSLFLFYTEEDERKLLPRLLHRGLVDGLVVQSTNADDQLFKQLDQSEIPYVVAGRPMNVSRTSYVDVDNVAGAYNGVRHLVHSGRKRVGIIYPPLDTTVGVDRFEGYKKALHESNLEYEACLCVEGDFTESGGYYAAQRLLAHQPDAIFASSDMMAVGALRAVREAGLSVPEDIAIVGFDDLPPAARATPPLTTIRQPIRQMGMKLVETLLDIIEKGTDPPRRTIMDTELVIRASCGAYLRD